VRNGWYDPETAWWAKHRHAQEHLERLGEICAVYRSSNPLEVHSEPTDVPGQTAYRLRQSAPIPVVISLIVGDLLHCLRSSLDSLVFGIVQDSLRRRMTSGEDRDCQFPICSSPVLFDGFFTASRVKIMDDRVRSALRGVQPFIPLEHLKKIRDDMEDLAFEEDSRSHPLKTVNNLSNIDKHRRLTVAAWFPSLISWRTDEDDGGDYQWRSAGAPPWEDDEVIGWMTGTGQGPKEVNHEFNLVIVDAETRSTDDWATRDLPDEAAEWTAQVSRVLHKVISDYTKPSAKPDDESSLVT
jgi:hypothetical protein